MERTCRGMLIKAKALENSKAGDIHTTAFGLGIDDRDGIIIRAGCPPTLEEMFQMFGQDGQEAEGN